MRSRINFLLDRKVEPHHGPESPLQIYGHKNRWCSIRSNTIYTNYLAFYTTPPQYLQTRDRLVCTRSSGSSNKNTIVPSILLFHPQRGIARTLTAGGFHKHGNTPVIQSSFFYSNSGLLVESHSLYRWATQRLREVYVRLEHNGRIPHPSSDSSL
jgi:hypothetical protein